jgi:DNA-binding NarL/FixJ family response regulator
MKILLVDDHQLFREGLVILLKRLDDNVNAVEAASCTEAFACLKRESDIELILLDVGLPDMSGLDGIAIIREQHPGIPVVVLSSQEDRASVLRALDQGAMGYIPKTSSSDVMIRALQLILANGIYLPPIAFMGASANPPSAVPAAAPGSKRPGDLGLSPRQAQVLFQILQGKPSKLICRDLNLSASTIKSHTSAVLRALNVTTRTQAVVAAGKLGLKFDPVRR